MSAKGNDSSVHFIRDGRFVCTAEPTAACRNYPACECEAWSAELHGDPPAEGHGDQPQDECWIAPWMDATDLCDTYSPTQALLDDDEFPDGPVSVEWNEDYLTWEYADGTALAQEVSR